MSNDGKIDSKIEDSESQPQLDLSRLTGGERFPTSGEKYNVKNFGFGHFLDNDSALPVDGNIIKAWSYASPMKTNQLWLYLEYPSSNGDRIFTLQCVSTLDDRSTIDDRGGYLSVDPVTNRLIQQGLPFPWKLVMSVTNVFKFVPVYDLYSDNGRLVATDQNRYLQSPQDNQVILRQNTGAIEQLWTFL